MNRNPNSLCWRPNWQRPFESLWSLLKKFAYLNAAGYPDLRELVGRAKSERTSPRGEQLRCDLNSLATVDDEKLRNLLGIESNEILQATALAYIKHEELIVLTSNQLRYCTDCMKAGFHSAIHQLLFLSHCPIHNGPLVTRCPECGTVAPRYTLGSITARRRTNCAHCFDSFAENFRQGINLRLTDDSQSRELAELGTWLTSACQPVGPNTTHLLVPSSESLQSAEVPNCSGYQGTGPVHFLLVQRLFFNFLSVRVTTGHHWPLRVRPS